MSVTFAAFRQDAPPESEVVGSHGPLDWIWMEDWEMMARWAEKDGKPLPLRTLRPTDAQYEEAGMCFGPNVSASNAMSLLREIGFPAQEDWQEGCFPLNVEDALNKVALFIAEGRGDEYSRTFALDLSRVLMAARRWNVREICGA